MFRTQFALNRFDWRSLDHFVADVKLSESFGYGYALNPFNALGLRDPYVWLSFAAKATTKIRLGPFIDNPMLKHPAVTASSIATLDEISGGRALLGLGVGDTAVRMLGIKPATVCELEIATIIARQLLAGEAVSVGAERPARMWNPRKVPVWIAAGGPKTLRMAGRIADGVFLRVGRHPKNLHHALENVRAGAAEAGRPAGEPSIGIVIHIITSQEPAAIRSISRAMAAGFYEYSPVLFENAGLNWTGPPVKELRTQVWPDFHHAEDSTRAGRVVDFLSEDVAESFSLFGSASNVAGQLRRALAELPPVEIIVPHPVPVPSPDSRFKRWFAEKVMPAL